MGERVVSSYLPLFQVQIFHHYWLDDGNTLFDTLPKDLLEKAALNLPDSTPTREQHLRSYDVRQFLSVAPSLTTAQSLSALGCIFRSTALGFVVAAPKTAVLPKDTRFEFLLTVNNPDFLNYTALTLRPQPIVEVFKQAENKNYRYKKNVPVLSNLTGVKKTEGSAKSLYLCKNFPALSADDKVEALVKIGTSLVQLSSDQSNAERLKISTQISKMPVFINQGDIPAEGILLEGIPDDVFALVRLAAVRADNDEFSFITAGGIAKTAAPVFQIRFKNRSTQWQYYHGNTAKNAPPFFVEPTPLPLTFFGNASTAKPNKKSKPLQGSVIARFDNSIPPKVLGINSEIFE